MRAYVLHHYPYRETSLMADLFTLEQGRVRVVARGHRKNARQPLSLFVPLWVECRGQHALRTLCTAEAQAPSFALGGQLWLSGMYLNELLLRLVAEGDAVPELFCLYEQTLARLTTETDAAWVLRCFEKHLLRLLGFALPLTAEGLTGSPLQAEQHYIFDREHGFIALNEQQHATYAAKNVFRGVSLLALADEILYDTAVLSELKVLSHTALAHLLGSTPLKTRKLAQRWYKN